MSDTESLPRQAVRPLIIRRPRLRLLYTAKRVCRAGHVFSLPSGPTLIGRKLPEPHREIVLADDSTLSSVHTRMVVTEDEQRVMVTDLGSKNGTFIGRRAVPQGDGALELRDGEVLRVGGSFFVLRYEPAHTPDATIPTLLGDSLAMRALRARIEKLAPESMPVLLLGETGTGKDVVANALHVHSGRQGELVALNCAAIPEQLAESELFGHVAHAFNNARRRPGAFVSAHEKTLFLDEIADLPEETQPKFLRALEEGRVRPVGSDTSVIARPRIVAATYQNLQALVDAKEFRPDLYNRLAHVVLRLPPLRERREDILPILMQAGRASDVLPPDLIEDLLLYDWPGNVRELLVVAERLRIEGDSEELRDLLRQPRPAQPREVESLPEPLTDATSSSPSQSSRSRPYRLPMPTRDQLITLLQKHNGTVRSVAQDLSCSRRQIQRWMEHYQIDADLFRPKKS
jgi:DNA-binding NtrC family response regulator